MSSDAKIWMEDEGGWLSWCGLHDGECLGTIPHDQGGTLSEIIKDVEACMGGQMRWEIQVYPDGKTGLRGWTW